MILLSCLIPSIPQRLPEVTRLIAILEAQSHPAVEVLTLIDNKRRPLGTKRNDMMAMAHGKYVCHLDDDDTVSEDFVATLLPELAHDVDLIAYDADCSLNGAPPFRVITRLGAENEQPKHLPGGRYSDIVRQPWQWCCWRADLARAYRFPDHYDAADDWSWLKQILPAVKTHRKVDRVMYHHFYNASQSSFPAK